MNTIPRPSFSWIPAGGKETASSRLRCYSLHEQLRARGFSSQIGGATCADVLVVQKMLEINTIRFARRFVLNPRHVLIFDIDDFFELEWYLLHLRKLSALADVISTATPEQADYLVQKVCRGNYREKLFVFENPVDYEITIPVTRLHQGSKQIRVVWFGFSENIPFETLNAVSQWKDFAITVITSNIDDIKSKLSPCCTLVEWGYRNFVRQLQNCDVAVLSHSGSSISRAKSANKMVSAIMAGIPVVASNTPDYARIANMCGVQECLFSNLRDLHDALIKLKDPNVRNIYLAKAQPRLASYYSIESASDRYINDINYFWERKKKLNIAKAIAGMTVRIARSFIG